MNCTCQHLDSNVRLNSTDMLKCYDADRPAPLMTYHLRRVLLLIAQGICAASRRTYITQVIASWGSTVASGVHCR